MICFFYSAQASPSWSSANLLTTCFSVLLKSNGSHHGKATICPKKFFPFPEIRGIIRVLYASFLIPVKNFAVFWVKFAIAIYPRKGTEAFLIQAFVIQSNNCNLSPQGDGNPQESLKNPLIWYCIYPRKGTETCSNPPKPPGNRLQFIPVRGRKPEKLVPDFDVCSLQLLPARG